MERAWEGWALWCEGRIDLADFEMYSIDDIDRAYHTLREYRRVTEAP